MARDLEFCQDSHKCLLDHVQAMTQWQPPVGREVGKRPKKSLCIQSGPPISGSLVNFIFFVNRNFLMWVGGWVGMCGSVGWGWLHSLKSPPPPGSLSNGLLTQITCSICAYEWPANPTVTRKDQKRL